MGKEDCLSSSLYTTQHCPKILPNCDSNCMVAQSTINLHVTQFVAQGWLVWQGETRARNGEDCQPMTQFVAYSCSVCQGVTRAISGKICQHVAKFVAQSCSVCQACDPVCCPELVQSLPSSDGQEVGKEDCLSSSLHSLLHNHVAI